MTQENLINLACRWLDFNQTSYITETFNSKHIVAGSCQTDLRAFLLFAIKAHPEDREVFYQDVMEEYKQQTGNSVGKELQYTKL